MARKKDNLKKKKFKVAKTSFYWLYFVGGTISILLSIFFAPFWRYFGINNETGKYIIPWASFYTYALAGMIALIILLYVFTILLKRIKKKQLHKVVRILFALEFSLMILLAALSLLKAIFYDKSEFKFFNTLELAALIIYIRGLVEIINAYYYDRKNDFKYPIWFLILNILLISFGPVLFYIGLKNPNVDTIVSYVLCAMLLFFGSFLCVCGCMAKPLKVIEEPVNNNNEIENNNNIMLNESNDNSIILIDEVKKLDN